MEKCGLIDTGVLALEILGFIRHCIQGRKKMEL
jgi:hypothetical protein